MTILVARGVVMGPAGPSGTGGAGNQQGGHAECGVLGPQRGLGDAFVLEIG